MTAINYISSETIEWVLSTLQVEGVEVIWLAPERLPADVAGFYSNNTRTVFVNSAWENDPFLEDILVHEFIHFLQDAYKLFIGEIYNEYIWIPTINYYGDLQSWKEYLIDMEYDAPDTAYKGDIVAAVTFEAAPYLLQKEHTKVKEWYEQWKYEGVNRW